MSGARFLDGLARTLAEPMPRRRALRLMGTSLVVVAVPGLRPRIAPAAQPTRLAGCGDDRRCCPRLENVGTGPDWPCGPPARRYGCGDARLQPDVCIDLCPPPGVPGSSAEKASDGFTAFVCCPKNTRPCITDRGEEATCCGDDQTCLKTATALVGLGCCPDNLVCRNECCAPSQVCRNGRCESCAEPERCGRVCCKPPNRCVAGVCRCPTGQKSCDGTACCGDTKTCAPCSDEGSGDIDIVGKKCCPPTQHCCGDRCCPRSTSCCHSKCCPARTECALSRGKDVCCPSARVATLRRQLGGLSVCCPRGTVGTEEGCCPPGSPECCPPLDDDGVEFVCSKGKVCVRGRCVKP